MRIFTLTVILGLPLMALAQTESQQQTATQGQANEPQTTAPVKGKKTYTRAPGKTETKNETGVNTGEQTNFTGHTRGATRTQTGAMNQTPQRKIVRGTEGIGTVAPQMVEDRAHEIARNDGRPQPNDLDRSRAREELTGAAATSEKDPTRKEPGRDWGMPLVSSGEKAPRVRPEDDENIPAKLIQEGIEEADRDQHSQPAAGNTKSERTPGKAFSKENLEAKVADLPWREAGNLKVLVRHV